MSVCTLVSSHATLTDDGRGLCGWNWKWTEPEPGPGPSRPGPGNAPPTATQLCQPESPSVDRRSLHVSLQVVRCAAVPGTIRPGKCRTGRLQESGHAIAKTYIATVATVHAEINPSNTVLRATRSAEGDQVVVLDLEAMFS